MTVNEIIQKRYAAKSFTGEKISEEAFLNLKESIIFAPSSFNWQPWKVKVVTDKALLEKLQGASFNQPQIGSASHLFIFCAIDSIKENQEKLVSKMLKVAPKEKVEAYESMSNGVLSNLDRDAQIRMSERELFMPVENLLLTATDLGYAACPVGGFDAKKYSEILKIPKNLTPVVIVPVGIPNDTRRPKVRLDENDVFF